jgi:hypothetical protein
MLFLEDPPTLAYLALGVFVIFRLPWLGHAILSLARDYRDFRGDERGKGK